jgi:hypothetical protein
MLRTQATAQPERTQRSALLDRRTGPKERKTPTRQGREVDLQTLHFCKRYEPERRTYLSDSGNIFQVSQAIFRPTCKTPVEKSLSKATPVSRSIDMFSLFKLTVRRWEHITLTCNPHIQRRQ